MNWELSTYSPLGCNHFKRSRCVHNYARTLKHRTGYLHQHSLTEPDPFQFFRRRILGSSRGTSISPSPTAAEFFQPETSIVQAECYAAGNWTLRWGNLFRSLERSARKGYTGIALEVRAEEEGGLESHMGTLSSFVVTPPLAGVFQPLHTSGHFSDREDWTARNTRPLTFQTENPS